MTKPLVDRALKGEERAIGELFAGLIPIFQREAARALYRRAHLSAKRAVRQELDDLVQESFSELLRALQRVLGGWDPQKGRTLENYLAVFARFTCASILRSGHRTPWRDLPTALDDLSRILVEEETQSPEIAAMSGDSLTKLLTLLKAELSSNDFDLMRRIYLEGQTTEEICEELKILPAALHQRKSRLRARMLQLAKELEL